MKNKYLSLFLTFFKLGLITFGGGYAMIANMKEEIVDKKKWTTDQELLEMIAVAESTPGPIAINMATYIGYKQGKFLGALLATLGTVLPSFIIIYVISLFFDRFLENVYVSYAFVGIKCAVAFLIIRAGLKLFKNIKKCWWQITICAIVTIIMIVLDLFSLKFSSIFLIIIGAILGIIINTIINAKNKKQKIEEVEVISSEEEVRESGDNEL